jgi:hypothetical protein
MGVGLGISSPFNGFKPRQRHQKLENRPAEKPCGGNYRIIQSINTVRSCG